MIEASMKRKYGKDAKFRNINDIKLHRRCVQKYTLKIGKSFAYPNVGNEAALKNTMYSSVKNKIRKCSESFDYTNLCFTCGKTASIYDKMRKEYRNNISLDTNPEFQIDFVRKISGINTNLGKTVLKRILCVDLLASQARYHRKNKLVINYVRPPTGQSRHRPPSEIIADYMNKITEYIDHSEESQFSFPELMKVADSNHCNVKTLKRNLLSITE